MIMPDERTRSATGRNDRTGRRPPVDTHGKTRSWGFGVSRGGLFFIFGMLLIGVVAIDADINLLLMIFGLSFGGTLLGLSNGWRTLRGLSVRRLAPEVLVAGQPFEIRYTVTNHRRWVGAIDISLTERLPKGAPIADIRTFIPYLAPGECYTFAVPALAIRRGYLRYDAIRLSTGYPLGLFQKSRLILQPAESVVFPYLGDLRSDIRIMARQGEASTGAAVTNRRGEEEYYGVREFRLGDNPHRIHWRRSARTGQLMVREMSRTSEEKLWCAVDTQAAAHDPDAVWIIERMISAAASTICYMLERGSKVGLILNGRPLVIQPPGAGRAYRPRLLRAVACCESDVIEPLAPQLDRLSWPPRWRGNCILFGIRDSRELRADAAILKRTLGPTHICIPNTPAFDAMFDLPESLGGATVRGVGVSHRTQGALNETTTGGPLTGSLYSKAGANR